MTVNPQVALPRNIIDGTTLVAADSVMPNFIELRDKHNTHTHTEYMASAAVMADSNLPAQLRSYTPTLPGNDFNQAILNGWYYSDAASTNAPPSGYYLVNVVNYDGNPHYRQTAYNYGADLIYTRRCSAGTWQPWLQVFPTAPLVTTLPASPVDGQEAILVDSLTVPTYFWHMRYNSAISKWVCIGATGPQLLTYTQETTTVAAAWTDMATVGPSFVIPRAGAYFASASAVMYSTIDRNNLCLGISIGSAGPFVGAYTDTLANLFNQVVITSFGLNLTAGQEVRVRYYQAFASTMGAYSRNLYVTPFTIT